jgi:S1-C subfamily serine protease
VQSPPRRRVLAMLAGAIACACAGGPGVREPLVRVIADAAPAVVAIGDHDTVFGSGFRVRDTRLIAAAAHVLKGLNEPPEVRWHGLRLAAHVVAIDDTADVGVLALEAEPPMSAQETG